MNGRSREQNRPARFSEGAARIPGVEIFRSGMHRSKPYSEDDIRDMVRNFNRYSTGDAKPGLNVPAVLGHEENQEWLERSDLPAAGWAKKLGYERQTCPICKGAGFIENSGEKKTCPDCMGKGTVLVAKADFGDIPRKVKKLIDGRQYKTVSAEVYDKIPDGLPDAGKESKMLRRVAFLGGEIPQIKSLEDIPVTDDHGETAAVYQRVELKCANGVCSDQRGTYTVFYEAHCGDRPRKFCQTGANRGKPGPCPEDRPQGKNEPPPHQGKPIGLAGTAAAAPREEKRVSRREEIHRRPIVQTGGKQRESVDAAAKALGPAKTKEIATKVGQKVTGAVSKLGQAVGQVVKDKAVQQAMVAAIVADGHSWANSTALQDVVHAGIAPTTLLAAGSRIAAFAAVAAMKHVKALGLFEEVEVGDQELQKVAPLAREFLRSIQDASGVKAPIPSDAVLASRIRKQLESGGPERFCQETKKPGPCKGQKRGGGLKIEGPRDASGRLTGVTSVAKRPARYFKPPAKIAGTRDATGKLIPSAARVTKAPAVRPHEPLLLEGAKKRISAAVVPKKKAPSQSTRRLKPGGVAAKKRIAEARAQNASGQRVVKTESKQPPENYTPGGYSQAKKKQYHPMIGWHSEGHMNRDEMLKKLQEIGYTEDELKDASDELLAAMIRHESEEGEISEEAEEPTGGLEEGETDAGPIEEAEDDDEGEGDEDEDLDDEHIDSMSEEEAKEHLKKMRDARYAEYADAGPGASERHDTDEPEPNEMPDDMSPPKFSERRGKRGRTVMKYSELRKSLANDIGTMVGEAIRRELGKEIDQGKKEFRSFKEKHVRTERRASITAFCEQMVKEGKLTPGDLRRGKQGEPSIIDDLMMLDDSAPVYKFSDRAGKQKKLTQLDMHMNRIRQRTPFKFGERIAVAGRLGGGSTIDSDKKRNVVQLCEKFSEHFAKFNMTGDEFTKLMDDKKISDKDKEAIIADLERAAAVA